MHKFSIKPIKEFKKEKIKIFANKFQCSFINFTGKSGEYWISYIPSLNVTGYGINEKEAMEDLKYNVELFSEDLLKLKLEQRINVLIKLGWDRHNYFKKQLSSTFVDEKGVLKNFDNPSEVKKSIIAA